MKNYWEKSMIQSQLLLKHIRTKGKCFFAVMVAVRLMHNTWQLNFPESFI
jgi:hypothetical protein